MFKPVYRPSIRCASLIMRLCVVATLTSGAVWYVIPAARLPWVGDALLAIMLLTAIMGAWHDGHANGEKKGRESGSALILILIAIVLFAGLTAAMNQGSRTSGGMVSDQQARLIATEILTYSKGIKQGIEMLLMRGCSESEISFENNHPDSPNYTNPNAPDDESCHVFSPKGAGMIFVPHTQANEKTTYSSLSEPYFWADSGVLGIGQDSQYDLILYVQSIKKQVCLSINDLLDIDNPSNDAPAERIGGNGKHTFYRGSFSQGSMGSPIGDDSPALVGKSTACVKRTDAKGMYQFYHVLIAR